MYVFALPLLLLLAACSEEDAPARPARDAGAALDDEDAGAGAPDGSVPDEPGDARVPEDEPCNGHVELCDRAFDQVVFPATHNAHSAQEYGYGAVNANQISGLQKQLDDGVRTMLLDVYEDAGEHVFCHVSCLFGKTSHLAGLQLLADFLEAHPREVFTIIYEDHLPVSAIAADFEAVGLDALTYTHAPGTPWPTLREMIDRNTRLVVTLETGDAPPAWAQNVWKQAWDTPFSFASARDFSCELNRGARENDLFLLNHWLTPGFTPSEDGASMVNTYDVLYGRAKGCWDEAGDVPNFVAVDFYEHGDLFRVVDALNGL